MRPRSDERCQSQPMLAVPRAFAEIVVAITASAIMALMVAGGGIAVERWASIENVAAAGSGQAPPPLSWRETT